MTDLVVMSLEAWDDVWRRNQHLMAGLVRADPTLRVLFVEPAADPLHAIRSGRKPTVGRNESDAGMPGRLWTMRPVKVLPRRVDRRADERLAEQVIAAAHRIGMEDPILWVNDPGAAPLARRTGWRTLYDMTDDWLAADRPDAELERIRADEEFLLQNADEVVACSPELVRRKSAQRPQDRNSIELVRNAVDVAEYRKPRQRPADLPRGRIVLYAGALHADRLDTALCIATANRLDDAASLVLVGPDALAPSVSAELRRAGVVLLGQVARRGHRLPAARGRADRPARRDSFHRQPRPDQALRVPGCRPAGRLDPVAGFRDAADDGSRDRGCRRFSGCRRTRDRRTTIACRPRGSRCRGLEHAGRHAGPQC